MVHKIDWQVKVEEFKQSGKTQTAWCKEQGIPSGTFQYHLKKYYPSAPKQFIELRSPPRGLKLRLGTICIELDPDFDEKTLSRFLQAIGRVC